MAARDPRLRPYRAAAWILYFGAIVLGVGLIVVSVARQLRGPSRPPVAEGPLPTRAALRVCLDDLETLFREQNQRAWQLGTHLEAADPFGDWNAWARSWEARVQDLSDRCRLDSGRHGEPGWTERVELAGARDAMRALHRAYAAQVNRFAMEQRDLVAGASESLAHAREAVKKAR